MLRNDSHTMKLSTFKTVSSHGLNKIKRNIHSSASAERSVVGGDGAAQFVKPSGAFLFL